MKTKFPKIPHLPWSLGKQSDDTSIDHLDCENIVVTEKLDGENTTMSREYIHARSLDSKDHPSRHWVKVLHSSIKYLIPEGIRIVGENVYAQHSIGYDKFTTYFYVFSVFENDVCLSWEDTVITAHELGLELVPVLYQGIYDEKAIKNCFIGKSVFGSQQEGYVVRNVDEFKISEFNKNIAKFVRENHVQTDEHWMHKAVVKNKLLE